MATSPSLAQLLATLEASLVDPTTAASQLPDAGDLGFERSLSRPFARNLDKEAARILSLVSNVLNWSQGTPTAQELDGDLIRDGEYRQVIDKVEPLLERADDSIERHLGVGKAKKGGVGAVGAKSAEELALAQQQKSAHGKQGNNKSKLPANLLHDADLARPQLLFPPRLLLPRPATDVDGAEPLWKPVLRQKPHAASTESWLSTELYDPAEDRFTLATKTAPPAFTRYLHPYAAELESLAPPKGYFAAPEEPPRPADDSFDKTPFEWVGDKIAFAKMLKEIREVGTDECQRDLAVDLEHHDYRSWGGFTCLMQLSTRKKDYVIDVLDPVVRDELEDLNEFFADPSWIKVFHGAASDIIWLQRDFGVYIVGLFDTYHATHVLGYPQHSLAYLLERYTNFEADKRYQLADWRIRPLNKEMLHYARSDTHYLLDIYDHLRLALHAKEASSDKSAMEVDSEGPPPTPLLDVYNRSIGTSSAVYSLPPYDVATGHQEGGWLGLLAKHQQLKAYATALAVPTLPIKTGWGPGELKLEVLKGVHEWREKIAREEDESTRWVMGNDQVWMVAERAPRDAVEVMKAVGMVRGGVSEILRKRKEEIAQIVRDVVERVGEMVVDDAEIVVGGVGEELRGEAALQPAVRPISGLWSAIEQELAPVASSSKVVATSSSFFGSSATPKTSSVAEGLVAATSGFFGSSKKSAVAKGKQVQTQSHEEERAAAVRRVHDSLVLGGGLAKSLEGQSIPAPAPPVVEEVVMEDEAPLEPVAEDRSNALTGDHSYVPLSARVPKPQQPSLLSSTASATPIAPAPSDSDVLIVSSLADKPKKRRRPVPTPNASTEDVTGGVVDPALASPQKKKGKKGKSAAVAGGEKAAPLAPHDYSTMKSVLDAEPRVSGLGKKEKKSKKEKEMGRAAKGFQIDTSDFRREPRVNNAPKKGNVAQSFAK